MTPAVVGAHCQIGAVSMNQQMMFQISTCVVGLVACGSGSTPEPEVADSALADAVSVDAPATISSCTGLPAICGATGNDSCCNSSDVPGGTYYRSYDLANDEFSGDMSSPATISAFRLDKYEVTVGRFRTFVAAGMGTLAHPPAPGAGAHANIPGSGWNASWNTALAPNQPGLVAALKCDPSFQTWTDAASGNENRPINCITWYEAMAFCVWDGGYLPTEAEWNFAAAGGDQQRAYPWSSPPGSLTPIDSSHASYADDRGCIGDGIPVCAVTDLTPAGSKPSGDGRWGQSELAGDVLEWMLDSNVPAYVNPCTDCAALTDAATRSIRGGAFVTVALGLRTGIRSGHIATDRDPEIGLRCARKP